MQNDEAARKHTEECDGCFAFLESLSRIEEGLQHMPRLDASDDVVEGLLARPEIANRASRGEWLRSIVAGLPRPRTLAWGSMAAAALIVVAAVGLRDRLPRPASDPFIAVNEKIQSGKSGELGRELEPVDISQQKVRGKLEELEQQLMDNENKGDKNLASDPAPDEPQGVGGFAEHLRLVTDGGEQVLAAGMAASNQFLTGANAGWARSCSRRPHTRGIRST